MRSLSAHGCQRARTAPHARLPRTMSWQGLKAGSSDQGRISGAVQGYEASLASTLSVAHPAYVLRCTAAGPTACVRCRQRLRVSALRACGNVCAGASLFGLKIAARETQTRAPDRALSQAHEGAGKVRAHQREWSTGRRVPSPTGSAQCAWALRPPAHHAAPTSACVPRPSQLPPRRTGHPRATDRRIPPSSSVRLPAVGFRTGERVLDFVSPNRTAYGSLTRGRQRALCTFLLAALRHCEGEGSL